MTKESDPLEALLLSALFDDATGSELSGYAGSAPMVMQALGRLDPIRTAAAYGALLIEPALQGSCLRLEALVHMALNVGATARKPTGDILAKLFSEIGKGSLGSAESEAESLFVGLITTRRGDFRVLEGSWVGSSFNLQRVVDVVDAMPKGARYAGIVEGLYALLKLSDLACERAKLRRYTPGQFQPVSRLPPRMAATAMARRRHIRFTPSDLIAAGVDPAHLAPFVLADTERPELLNNGWGGTPLERRPVVRDGDIHYLVLPSSVSLAIRRFVIESVQARGDLDLFGEALGNAYAKWFMGLSHFGSRTARDLHFQHVRGGRIASVSRQVDAGRHLQFIFLLDDLDQIDQTGFEGFNPTVADACPPIDNLIEQAHDLATSSAGFRDGLTLVVACGVGRPTGIVLQPTPRANWSIETMTAADLEVLSQLSDFKPLSLWGLLDARRRIHAQGARLYFPDGLLQLAGQTRLADGHLVDHGAIEDGSVSEDRILIIPGSPYATLRARQEAAENWDRRVLRDIDNRWREVSKKGLPIFEEDRDAAIYIELDVPQRGVSVTDQRSWWWRIDNRSTDGRARYQRWQTLEVWMRRAAPVLDRTFPSLGAGAIEWVASFDGALSQSRPDEEPIDFLEARASLTPSANAARREVKTHATATFERAFAVVDNIAERALVECLVKAVALLAETIPDAEAIKALVDEIVPSPLARQTHAFRNPSFRDYVRGSLSGSVVIIGREQDATSRIGLGWKVLGRDENPRIEGKEASRSFLNQLVTRLEDDLIAEVRLFDRKKLVDAILRNHELAAIEEADFKRTAAATLALHDDKTSTLATLGRKESELNAVALTSRILMEFAVCEAPLAGGLQPGALDLGRLMSLAAIIFYFGGDSDAVRWDAMRPTFRVTPLGDVHAYRDFATEIVEPFGRQNADLRFEDAVENYADNVEAAGPEEAGARSQDGPTQAFQAALEETMGAPGKAFGSFVSDLEQFAIAAGAAVMTAPRSGLIAVGTDGGLDPMTAAKVVDALTFVNRSGWRNIPENYPDSDRQPWRFRRQLSVLRRPLLKIDDGEDPLIAFAPGLVHQAWEYTVRNFYRGDFPDRHLSKKMISWKAKVADQRGKTFGKDVEARLKEAGWQTDREVKMTRLLDRGFDRDYGDVDVLAWKPAEGRVLLIECKDVQFRKTFGEVAEQLADFRGEINDKRKRDYLLRHLDRMDLARAHIAAVGKFVGMPGLSSIESHLVFRNPVPMKYTLTKLQDRVATHVFADIAAI